MAQTEPSPGEIESEACQSLHHEEIEDYWEQWVADGTTYLTSFTKKVQQIFARIEATDFPDKARQPARNMVLSVLRPQVALFEEILESDHYNILLREIPELEDTAKSESTNFAGGRWNDLACWQSELVECFNDVLKHFAQLQKGVSPKIRLTELQTRQIDLIRGHVRALDESRSLRDKLQLLNASNDQKSILVDNSNKIRIEVEESLRRAKEEITQLHQRFETQGQNHDAILASLRKRIEEIEAHRIQLKNKWRTAEKSLAEEQQRNKALSAGLPSASSTAPSASQQPDTFSFDCLLAESESAIQAADEHIWNSTCHTLDPSFPPPQNQEPPFPRASTPRTITLSDSSSSQQEVFQQGSMNETGRGDGSIQDVSANFEAPVLRLNSFSSQELNTNYMQQCVDTALELNTLIKELYHQLKTKCSFFQIEKHLNASHDEMTRLLNTLHRLFVAPNLSIAQIFETIEQLSVRPYDEVLKNLPPSPTPSMFPPIFPSWPSFSTFIWDERTGCSKNNYRLWMNLLTPLLCKKLILAELSLRDSRELWTGLTTKYVTQASDIRYEKNRVSLHWFLTWAIASVMERQLQISNNTTPKYKHFFALNMEENLWNPVNIHRVTEYNMRYNLVDYFNVEKAHTKRILAASASDRAYLTSFLSPALRLDANQVRNVRRKVVSSLQQKYNIRLSDGQELKLNKRRNMLQRDLQMEKQYHAPPQASASQEEANNQEGVQPHQPPHQHHQYHHQEVREAPTQMQQQFLQAGQVQQRCQQMSQHCHQQQQGQPGVNGGFNLHPAASHNHFSHQTHQQMLPPNQIPAPQQQQQFQQMQCQPQQMVQQHQVQVTAEHRQPQQMVQQHQVQMTTEHHQPQQMVQQHQVQTTAEHHQPMMQQHQHQQMHLPADHPQPIFQQHPVQTNNDQPQQQSFPTPTLWHRLQPSSSPHTQQIIYTPRIIEGEELTYAPRVPQPMP